MRRRLAVLGVVLALLPLASCGRGAGDQTYILNVQGTAEVSGAGTTQVLHGGHHHIALGRTIRVTQGTAVLGLPARASLELRAAASSVGNSANSTVRVASMPTLVDGDALVVSGAHGAKLTAGVTTMSLAGGAARVRRTTGVTMAVYQGEATVEALGQRLPAPVPAFRQVAVSETGALPRLPVPLVYDRHRLDPWDVRYLGDAIDLGEQLDLRSRALTSQLVPVASPDARYLTSVVPALRGVDGFGDSLVEGHRSVGETVVGASIALGGVGDFVRRWVGAFTFRAQGADWGLVAADQQAQRLRLFGVLDGVLDRVTGGFAGPLVGGTSPTTPATTTPHVPGHGGGSSPTTTTSTTGPLTSILPTIPPMTLPRPQSPPSSTTTTTTRVPLLPTPVVPQPLGDLLSGLLGGSSISIGPTVL